MNLKRLLLLLILADNELRISFDAAELHNLFWLKEEGYLQQDEWTNEISVSTKGQDAVDAALDTVINQG